MGRPSTISRLGLGALALLAALTMQLVLATGALADALTPESGGSPNADAIDELYKLVLIVAALVFVIVEGLLIYSLVRYRARRGAVAAQIHGNTRLEVGWTVAAALILVVLSVFTFLKLDEIRNPPNSGPEGLQLADGVLLAGGPGKRLPPNGKALNICVNGQQYIWSYTYAADCSRVELGSVRAYEEMVVPTETTVTLDIRAQDVVHSWWIPQLGGKFDAVPGYTNYTWMKIPASKAGTVFRGQCAELCGRNHANMIATVRAVTPQEFEAWLEEQKVDTKAGDDAAAETRKQLEQS